MPPDKESLMPPRHCCRAEMGEGRLNSNPFLWMHSAGQPLMQSKPATLHDATHITREERNELPSLKKEVLFFFISNRYDTTFN